MNIDLNADLGESFGRWQLGDDAALVPLLSSANVACGFHAGDPLTLRTTVRAAAAAGVVVGAQVGYRDLAGFGRRYIDMEPDELAADVLYQLGALDGICRAEGTAVRYLKPHGALYHAVSTDPVQAGAVVDAVRAWQPGATVVGLPGSVFLDLAADAGLRPIREAFADRGYRADGSLVSRREAGAVLGDPDEVAARVVQMVTTGSIPTVDGGSAPFAADSICVHGDSPGAVASARAVREALAAAGVEVMAFEPRS